MRSVYVVYLFMDPKVLARSEVFPLSLQLIQKQCQTNEPDGYVYHGVRVRFLHSRSYCLKRGFRTRIAAMFEIIRVRESEISQTVGYIHLGHRLLLKHAEPLIDLTKSCPRLSWVRIASIQGQPVVLPQVADLHPSSLLSPWDVATPIAFVCAHDGHGYRWCDLIEPFSGYSEHGPTDATDGGDESEYEDPGAGY